MSYYCDICNKIIKHKSNIRHFKSLTHRNFYKCKHIKITIKNPDINKIDNIVYEYIFEHNKKFDYYLIKCDFKLVFNNSEFSPCVTSKLFDNKTMIS